MATGLLIDSVRHVSESGGFCDRSGLCFGLEESEMHGPAVDADTRSPFSRQRIPTDASKNRCGIETSGQVLPVAVLWDGAQIHAPIVKAVVVDMVAFPIILTGKAEQFSVHKKAASSLPHAAGVGEFLNADGVPLTIQHPAPLACPDGIGSVDDHVCSDGFSVMGVQGNAGGLAILAQQNRCGDVLLRNALTGARAEQRNISAAGANQEGAAANTAGTLYGHRLPPAVGVTPPDGCTSRGQFRASILPRRPDNGSVGHL